MLENLNNLAPYFVISVNSRKGGVGKTTTAAQLGLALLEQGYEVLFLDMDLTGTPATRAFENYRKIDIKLGGKIHLVPCPYQNNGGQEKKGPPLYADLLVMFNQYSAGKGLECPPKWVKNGEAKPDPSMEGDDSRALHLKMGAVNVIPSHMHRASVAKAVKTDDWTAEAGASIGPSLLFSPRHGMMLMEMIVKLVERAARHLYLQPAETDGPHGGQAGGHGADGPAADGKAQTPWSGKPLAVILDNSPGHSGLVPEVELWLSRLGPHRGKILFVSTLETQDIDVCVDSLGALQRAYEENWVAAWRIWRRTDQLRLEKGDDKGIEESPYWEKAGQQGARWRLGQSAKQFYAGLLEAEDRHGGQCNRDGGGNCKKQPAEKCGYCFYLSDQFRKVNGERPPWPSTYLGLIVNKVPRGFAHRYDYKWNLVAGSSHEHDGPNLFQAWWHGFSRASAGGVSPTAADAAAPIAADDAKKAAETAAAEAATILPPAALKGYFGHHHVDFNNEMLGQFLWGRLEEGLLGEKDSPTESTEPRREPGKTIANAMEEWLDAVRSSSAEDIFNSARELALVHNNLVAAKNRGGGIFGKNVVNLQSVVIKEMEPFFEEITGRSSLAGANLSMQCNDDDYSNDWLLPPKRVAEFIEKGGLVGDHKEEPRAEGDGAERAADKRNGKPPLPEAMKALGVDGDTLRTLAMLFASVVSICHDLPLGSGQNGISEQRAWRMANYLVVLALAAADKLKKEAADDASPSLAEMLVKPATWNWLNGKTEMPPAIMTYLLARGRTQEETDRLTADSLPNWLGGLCVCLEAMLNAKASFASLSRLYGLMPDNDAPAREAKLNLLGLAMTLVQREIITDSSWNITEAFAQAVEKGLEAPDDPAVLLKQVAPVFQKREADLALLHKAKLLKLLLQNDPDSLYREVCLKLGQDWGILEKPEQGDPSEQTEAAAGEEAELAEERA